MPLNLKWSDIHDFLRYLNLNRKPTPEEIAATFPPGPDRDKAIQANEQITQNSVLKDRIFLFFFILIPVCMKEGIEAGIDKIIRTIFSLALIVGLLVFLGSGQTSRRGSIGKDMERFTQRVVNDFVRVFFKW